jgi:YD repeat-containing protein
LFQLSLYTGILPVFFYSHWGEQGWKHNGNGLVVAERSKRGHERQARLFGYDSELNLCELSHILAGEGQPLSSQQAQAEPLRRYDAAGRVSQMGPNQYRYDKCGRLSEKVVSRPGFRPQTTQFEWDGFDRLQRVILPDGSRWRYRYDRRCCPNQPASHDFPSPK